MKKITKATIATTLTATAIAGNSLVKADEVETLETATPQVETQAETKQVPTVQEVNQAKSDLDQANTAVESQSAVVATVQADVEAKTTEVSQAQEAVATAQANVAQATAENIAKAESTVSEKETALSTVQSNVASAENAVVTAQADVNVQVQAVATVQTDVADKQADVASAESAVATAQANLDGTGASQVIANQETAQLEKAQAEAELTTAQGNLTEAIEKDRTRSLELSLAETAVRNRTTEANQAQAELATAQATATQATATLETAQANLTTAEKALEGKTRFEVPAEYVAALKEYASATTTSDQETALSKLKALNSAMVAKNNFVADPNDSKTAYATNNLPESVVREITYYANDIQNQIRTAFGTQLSVITEGAIEFADKVAKQYIADGFDFQSTGREGHDFKAINDIAKSYGLEYNPYNTWQSYENLYTKNRTQETMTITQLKEFIFNSFVGFMYNGYEWEHAKAIANTNNFEESFGVSVSLVKSNYSALATHVITVPKQLINAGSTFNTTAITNPLSSDNAQATYNQAKSAYDVAVTANATAQASLVGKQSAYNVATANLAQAQSNLSTLQAQGLLTPNATTALAQAQANLASKTEALELANKAVESLNASVQEKTALLAQAKANLASKQAELVKSQKVLAQEQASLQAKNATLETSQQAVVTAQAVVKQAEKELEEAKQALYDLQNAPALLAQAQTTLAVKQADLTALVSKLASETDKLTPLVASQREAESHYKALNEAYSQQEQERIKAEYEAIQKTGGTPVAVVAEDGTITGYIDVKVTPQTTRADKVQKATYGATPVRQLPNTGTAGSFLTVLGVSLLVSLGAVKRKED